MKALFFLLTFLATVTAQQMSVRFDTANNALTLPLAGPFRTANGIQQQSAALDALGGNTVSTVNIGNVQLNLKAASTFGGGSDRAVTYTPGGGGTGTVSNPNTLIVPTLSVTSIFHGPEPLGDFTGSIFGTGYNTTGTNPVTLWQSSNAGFNGKYMEVKNAAGTSLFSVTTNMTTQGNVNWNGTATGNGAGITGINAANLSSGTIPVARLGTGTPSSIKFVNGSGAWVTPNLSTDVQGVLPAVLGGPAVWADATARATFTAARQGQLGVQLSTGGVWVANSTTPGDWNATINFDGTVNAGTYLNVGVDLSAAGNGGFGGNLGCAGNFGADGNGTILGTFEVGMAAIFQGDVEVVGNVFFDLGFTLTADEAATSVGQKWKRTATATDYTVLLTDHIIGVTSTAAARVVTLPDAATAGDGKVYIVKDESGAAGGNAITVKSAGGTLNGVAAGTGVPINTNYGTSSWYSNGTNWFSF